MTIESIKRFILYLKPSLRYAVRGLQSFTSSEYTTKNNKSLPSGNLSEGSYQSSTHVRTRILTKALYIDQK